jgi:hypothetical protein
MRTRIAAIIRKLGVFFETAVVVFDDPDFVMTRDRIGGRRAMADDWVG